jgi:hypothetical protein
MARMTLQHQGLFSSSVFGPPSGFYHYRPGTPLKIVGGELPKGKTFGSSLAEAVDVDLGEF